MTEYLKHVFIDVPLAFLIPMGIILLFMCAFFLAMFWVFWPAFLVDGHLEHLGFPKSNWWMILFIWTFGSAFWISNKLEQ